MLPPFCAAVKPIVRAVPWFGYTTSLTGLSAFLDVTVATKEHPIVPKFQHHNQNEIEQNRRLNGL